MTYTNKLILLGISFNFYSYGGAVHALNGVYLDVYEGETIGLVGETGCGKSAMTLAILRLVPAPGRIVKGEIIFEDEDPLKKVTEYCLHYKGE